ncbi:MAG: iron chaperone [Actinomycetales bacterium]
MPGIEIDEYLDRLDEPRRSTLQTLRELIAQIIPEAEEGLSYGAPVFRIAGRPVAGFSAAKHHLSYLPHSGQILATVSGEQLAGFSASKGAVRMPIDTPLPAGLVRTLIDLRRAELGV